MADKVDEILEKMVDELIYYKDEGIFSHKEVKKIVKSRREAEYQCQRKDAQVAFFLDAIKYEQQLEKVKVKRKKKLDKGVDFKHDNSIKRRVINLYERACRKYKQNKMLWKEYL